MSQNFTMKTREGSDWKVLYPKTIIPQVEGLQNELDSVNAIAKGKARARVFDTVADMEAWIAVPANTATLQAGDNFYIREVEVPDYWWDGTKAIDMEVEKVVFPLAGTTGEGFMSADDYIKLRDIAPNANNYSHPTGDGNTHVPATSTTSNGKVLTAGATQSSASWKTLTEANIADRSHTHPRSDLQAGTIAIGSTEPAGLLVGDIWFQT